MSRKLDFLALFQAKSLYDFHRQGYRERTSGLHERAFHVTANRISTQYVFLAA